MLNEWWNNSRDSNWEHFLILLQSWQGPRVSLQKTVSSYNGRGVRLQSQLYPSGIVEEFQHCFTIADD